MTKNQTIQNGKTFQNENINENYPKSHIVDALRFKIHLIINLINNVPFDWLFETRGLFREVLVNVVLTPNAGLQSFITTTKFDDTILTFLSPRRFIRSLWNVTGFKLVNFKIISEQPNSDIKTEEFLWGMKNFFNFSNRLAFAIEDLYLTVNDPRDGVKLVVDNESQQLVGCLFWTRFHVHLITPTRVDTFNFTDRFDGIINHRNSNEVITFQQLRNVIYAKI